MPCKKCKSENKFYRLKSGNQICTVCGNLKVSEISDQSIVIKLCTYCNKRTEHTKRSEWDFICKKCGNQLVEMNGFNMNMM
jgi:Zn finger protein HypA/HybF involved in hydrogenase expression